MLATAISPSIYITPYQTLRFIFFFPHSRTDATDKSANKTAPSNSSANKTVPSTSSASCSMCGKSGHAASQCFLCFGCGNYSAQCKCSKTSNNNNDASKKDSNPGQDSNAKSATNAGDAVPSKSGGGAVVADMDADEIEISMDDLNVDLGEAPSSMTRKSIKIQLKGTYSKIL